MLDHGDDAGTQLGKMLKATNELVELYTELEATGEVLNVAKGKHANIKAKIASKKSYISSLKESLKAERPY